MSNYEFFEVQVGEGVATVTMNRPPLNVLHIPMMAEFNELLGAALSRADVSAVLLNATGKAFSAGVDVGDHSADKVGEMIRLFHGIFRRLIASDVLSVAAVQGAALGGGCELACACDIVLASDRAKFGQPEVQVGVFPPAAACLLPPQIGVRKAVEFTALGATIDAAEALRIGLVNQVYPADGFDAAVQKYVDGIRKLSRPVVRLAKRAATLVSREQILAHLEQTEQLYLGDLMKLADAHEGIAAFLEKRPPKWKHE